MKATSVFVQKVLAIGEESIDDEFFQSSRYGHALKIDTHQLLNPVAGAGVRKTTIFVCHWYGKL